MSDPMMEKRIVVPDGMMKAVSNTWEVKSHKVEINKAEAIIQAALRWLSENPIVPTRQNLEDMRTDWEDTPEQNAEKVVIFLISEWQRRIFLAPESEVPEAVKNLLLDGADFIHGQKHADEANKNVIEAYNRGLKEGK